VGPPLEYGVALMTHNEILLAAAIVTGFVLLMCTLGAFIVSRPGVGLALLVASGAVFVAALVFMSRVSHEQEHALRVAVNAKYDVHVQKWGEPLGVSPKWEIDGRVMDCDADVADESDPVLTCNGHELPLR
jgi:hypothetical protein